VKNKKIENVWLNLNDRDVNVNIMIVVRNRDQKLFGLRTVPILMNNESPLPTFDE
jgi:hypothetical protein